MGLIIWASYGAGVGFVYAYTESILSVPQERGGAREDLFSMGVYENKSASIECAVRHVYCICR